MRDNGIGIGAGDSERSFEMFQRLQLRADCEATQQGVAAAPVEAERAA